MTCNWWEHDFGMYCDLLECWNVNFGGGFSQNWNLHNYAGFRSRAERGILSHAEREAIWGLKVQDFACAERGKFSPRWARAKYWNLSSQNTHAERGRLAHAERGCALRQFLRLMLTLSVAQDAHAEHEQDAGQNLKFNAGAERGVLGHAERQASGENFS